MVAMATRITSNGRRINSRNTVENPEREREIICLNTLTLKELTLKWYYMINCILTNKLNLDH